MLLVGKLSIPDRLGHCPDFITFPYKGLRCWPDVCIVLTRTTNFGQGTGHKMKFRRIWQGLLFTAFTFTGLTANAGLILTLDDGDGNQVTRYEDGSGLVVFMGPLGDWTMNITSGWTNPLIGTDHVNAIDMLSGNSTTNAPGTLTITLKQDGLEGSPSNWIAWLGGTTDGTIDFSLLLNDVVVADYYASTGAFHDSGSGQIDVLGPYSLTLVATITHDHAGDMSSFDYHVKVPEPSTLALLGSGLLLTGWAGRRRSRQAAR
jgi:PEP-CTERM motif